MSRKERTLDAGAVLAGLMLGLVIGAGYALLHISKSGAVRRRDLAGFGAGSLELEIEASLDEAKELARQRRQEAD